MREQLENKLKDEFPSLYMPPNIPYGFECGDGWFTLLRDLSNGIISALSDCDGTFYVIQVKEKWGGLRYYTQGVCSDVLTRLIGDSERLSMTVCEVCGSPGKLRKGGWLSTLCDSCSSPATRIIP
jgi:hypothetical protein